MEAKLNLFKQTNIGEAEEVSESEFTDHGDSVQKERERKNISASSKPTLV